MTKKAIAKLEASDRVVQNGVQPDKTGQRIGNR